MIDRFGKVVRTKIEYSKSVLLEGCCCRGNYEDDIYTGS